MGLGGAVEGPAVTTPEVEIMADLRLSLFSTVFILDKTLPSPRFSFSWGADGPDCACELILG